jgi:hypothetical protein
MKISKEVVKQFCNNIESAPDPVGFFMSEASRKRGYFDGARLSQEFEVLEKCAIQNDPNKLKALARDLRNRL